MAWLLQAEIYSCLRRRLLLNRRDGLRGSQTIEQGIDRKNEKPIRKAKKHAEEDSQDEPKTVRLEVWDPKCPDFLEFLHFGMLMNFGFQDDAGNLVEAALRRAIARVRKHPRLRPL